MKRSFKILTLLLIGLFLLISGLDSALDHYARSTTQSNFTWYNPKGEIVLAYSGDLSYCKVYTKPVVPPPVTFLHRTSYAAPVSSGLQSRWF